MTFFEITMNIALKILHYMEPMRLLCYNCTVFDYVHGRKGVMELMMWSFRREESFWWQQQLVISSVIDLLRLRVVPLCNALLDAHKESNASMLLSKRISSHSSLSEGLCPGFIFVTQFQNKPFKLFNLTLTFNFQPFKVLLFTKAASK